MSDPEAPGDVEQEREDPADQAPAPAPDEAERKPVWDPATRTWVDPSAIEHEARTPIELPPVTPRPPAAQAPSPPPLSRSTRPAPPGSSGWAVPLLAGVVGAVLAVVAMLFVPGFLDPRERVARPAETPSATEVPIAQTADLARSARPWVVQVQATSTGAGKQGSRSAAGVLIRPDGLIATSARSVAGTQQLRVTMPWGRSVDATFVGADRVTDVAVLRVAATDVPAAVLGTAELLEAGEPIVAVSVTADNQPIVASGSVSALGRGLDAGEGLHLQDLIQVDAPLAALPAGGVLVGSGGAAIGLTTSASDGGGFGYATPIDVVRAIATQLVDKGRAEHPWPGVVVDSLDHESSLRLDLRGLVVARVLEGPATGIVREGDIIIGIDGKGVEGALTLLRRALEHRVSDQMVLRVIRDGQQQDVSITLAERPDK